MSDLTRRQALKLSSLGLAVAGGSVLADDKQGDDKKPAKKTDRECVMEAGMTADEADCWELIAKAAGKFFELPQQHPMDKQEVASAIHIVQNKLLSRPTYRKYLEAHKKGQPPAGEKK